MEQTNSSAQSDGNFSEVEVFDDSDGLYKRIEVFRASQPMDKYGITAAGSTAEAICGEDHLEPGSNRVFRNLYSEGQGRQNLTALFEVSEELNPDDEPDGTWEIRARDLDVNSPAFGEILRITLRPRQQTGRVYDLEYELRDPDADRSLVTSPLEAPVAEQVTDLADIGGDVTELGRLSDRLTENPIQLSIDETTTGVEIDDRLAPLMELRNDDDYDVHLENLESYMRFGDYGPKSTHPGTNLIGNNPENMADSLVWRAYRADMVSRGRPFLSEMSGATDDLEGPVTVGDNDAKPGVYSLFVMANELGISQYELAVDKVYSDYCGVPMEQSPGSRMETGAEPEVDARRAIKTLGDVSQSFYLRSNSTEDEIAAASQARPRKEMGDTDD